MKKISMLFVIIVLLVFWGCVHEHAWQEATCIKPKVCTVCEETEGEATGHTWQEATSTEPKKCIECEETEGDPLGHTPGEWMEESNVAGGYYKKIQKCTVCSEELNSEMKFYSCLYEEGQFIFTPKEFTERLNSVYRVLEYDMQTDIGILDDDSFVCGIMNGGDALAVVSFNNEENIMQKDEIEAREISSMMIYYYTDEVSQIVESMEGIMFTCDPQLKEKEALVVAQKIVDASMKNDYYEYNGIKYGLTVLRDHYFLVVSVLNK